MRRQSDSGRGVEDEIGNYTPGRGGRSGDRDSGSADSRRPTRTALGVPNEYRTTAPRSSESFRGMSANAIEGWTKQGAGPGSLREQGPRYFDGDEWKPASMGTDSIIDRQRALVIAGFLSPTEGFRLGAWDEPTRDAYKQLLEYANASGLTADVALQRYAEGQPPPGGMGGGPGGGGGGGSGGPGSESYFDPMTGEWVTVTEKFVPPPLELRTSNKDDLRRVMRSAVVDKLGEGWSQAQIDELVEGYNWQEIKLQKDAYDQQVAAMETEFNGGDPSGKPITELSMASPETYIEDEMMKRDPVGVQEGQVVQELMPSIMSNLQGWV